MVPVKWLDTFGWFTEISLKSVFLPYFHNIGVGRFRILGGPRFRILGGGRGGLIPSRHMTS